MLIFVFEVLMTISTNVRNIRLETVKFPIDILALPFPGRVKISVRDKLSLLKFVVIGSELNHRVRTVRLANYEETLSSLSGHLTQYQK